MTMEMPNHRDSHAACPVTATQPMEGPSGTGKARKGEESQLEAQRVRIGTSSRGAGQRVYLIGGCNLRIELHEHVTKDYSRQFSIENGTQSSFFCSTNFHVIACHPSLQLTTSSTPF